MELHGRRVIYTDVDNITEGNILDALSHAMATHVKNRAEIEYLYNYYRGKQPILNRTKEVREDICNRIVENIANEIVSFKSGYLMYKPIQYINRGVRDEDTVMDAINALNNYVFAEDKVTKDKEIADWFHICGTAYRMILPDPTGYEDEAPFEIYTLDPRNTFVVYHNGLGNKPVMGVRYITKENGETVYSVYTRNRYFEITADGIITAAPLGRITKSEGHIYRDIPIIEYPANTARLGAFEIVITLLDALNEAQSNRLDGVEQFIQALLVLKGVDIEAEDYMALKEYGGIKLPADGEAYYLTQELNQSQTQTLVDDMYQTILVICGMPNRNGGSSTSDTGAAVIMRDGWSDAEARAQDTEDIFKASEKRFLRLAIDIVNTYRDLDLNLSDIDIHFTRRNYENIESKAQVLTTMLANDKIHPKLAFEHCGMFCDSDLAYTQSMEYWESRKQEAMKELEAAAEAQTNEERAEAEDTEDTEDDV